MWPEHWFFLGVTHEWISSLFEISVVFWIVLMFSFSCLDDIIVGFKLLVYDVWSAEEDRIGFLSVAVDIFDQLYLKERPISLPTVKISTINKYMINDIMWEKSTKSKYVKILMNNQNIMFG